MSIKSQMRGNKKSLINVILPLLASLCVFVILIASPTSASSSFIPRKSRASLQDVVSRKVLSSHKKHLVISQNGSQDNSFTTDLQSSHIFDKRGGDAGKVSELQTICFGVGSFVLMDHLFRKAFVANGIAFPSQLGGCCILFFFLLFVNLIRPGLGDSIFQLLSPGSNLLAKWLPVFFVPGLVMFPLAPSMGSSLEFIKVLATVVIGFYYTASTTSYAVLALRKMQGASNTPAVIAPPSNKKGPITPVSPPKPFSKELLNDLIKAFVLSGAISLGATMTNNQYASPIRAIFMTITTFTGYVWGARLPSSFTKVVHPLVTSTFVTLITTFLVGMLIGTPFKEVLATYKSGSLSPMTIGAGDFLLYLLGPSVVSFAIAMYSRKTVMAQNLLVVITSVLVPTVGGLFGTAAFARLLGIGGKAGRILRLSLLPRNVTTPLAIAITNILGGDISLAALVVVFTGIFGATYGGRILTTLGVHDPVARGLGIGAAAQGLGVASFVNEKEAFPFAAISMVLTAVGATTLVSIPFVKDALIAVATGPNCD
eukprot:CAMPEP_0184859528 /NCGR_PEP_ID=MMETSP0580-20130426/4494_1 /TAXON_ID=1118495 /ORGANISM="Dactyliosolen fragilissimus" /LENGTH=540 /DNA_ID=CAMNT_0027356181 /DNA_START=98 /DNA_END=1720 /DNA_ORIENTATION=-